MAERKPPRYSWHDDMDRSTAGERIPIGGARRYEFAEGVYLGAGEGGVDVPPLPRKLTGWELAVAERAAYFENKRKVAIRRWAVALKTLGWLALVVGALLMVAVTR